MRQKRALSEIVASMTDQDRKNYRKGTRDPDEHEIRAVDAAIEFESGSRPDHPLLKQETTRSESWRRPWRGQ
jgi:hypothetical protein